MFQRITTLRDAKPVAPPVELKARCIEKLLHWTYIDELPKRKLSSAEGIWDGIAEYGQRGGIDVGHGAAQRYPHFGLPHKDALIIEKAVAALPSVVIDWAKDYEALAADLAPLVSVNDLDGRIKRLQEDEMGFPIIEEVRFENTRISRPKEGGLRSHPAPRDVLLVNTIDVETLVFTHACKGDRPSRWRVTEMRAVPTLAERGPHAKIIGRRTGRNYYEAGSHCPLRWSPSPIAIVLARANYVAWYRALAQLARSLQLTEHLALPPSMAEFPWLDDAPVRPVIGPLIRIGGPPLPLNPARKLAGPRKKRGTK